MVRNLDLTLMSRDRHGRIYTENCPDILTSYCETKNGCRRDGGSENQGSDWCLLNLGSDSAGRMEEVSG